MSTRIRELARAFVGARREHRALVPADWQVALTDSDDAYAVQTEVANAFGWFPGGMAGAWKSGGPSRDTPLTHAPLAPEGIQTSPADFSAWPFFTRSIEAEVALRVGRDIDPRTAALLMPEAANAVIDMMCVSIEIVDTRWSDLAQASPLMRLADFQSHGALVLGKWMPYERRAWAAQHCEVLIGGQGAVMCTGTHSLGDPAWLLPTWLRHATRGGQTVPAGTVVTTGTWVGMLPVQRGDAVTVQFEGIGNSRVQL
jgi:2-keto-4-pentenoate hydratase